MNIRAVDVLENMPIGVRGGPSADVVRGGLGEQAEAGKDAMLEQPERQDRQVYLRALERLMKISQQELVRTLIHVSKSERELKDAIREEMLRKDPFVAAILRTPSQKKMDEEIEEAIKCQKKNAGVSEVTFDLPLLVSLTAILYGGKDGKLSQEITATLGLSKLDKPLDILAQLRRILWNYRYDNKNTEELLLKTDNIHVRNEGKNQSSDLSSAL